MLVTGKYSLKQQVQIVKIANLRA